jgi:hypothetical protein
MARSWVRNICGSARQKRIARRPMAGLGIECEPSPPFIVLSAPTSSVRRTTGLPSIAFATCR